MNVIDLFLKAGIFVQFIMIVLLIFSVASWAIMYQRAKILRDARKEIAKFEDKFWSGENLSVLYKESAARKNELSGIEHIFYAGFKEFARLHQLNGSVPQATVSGATRAMQLSANKELESLEQSIPFLGTVGSISPYIGLFGTVWGIMHAFLALGEVKQATLQMVAPGIAEALIATAMGLFAAIPAVIAYNRLNLNLNRIEQSYFNFMDEFTAILHRQAFSTVDKQDKP